MPCFSLHYDHTECSQARVELGGKKERSQMREVIGEKRRQFMESAQIGKGGNASAYVLVFFFCAGGSPHERGKIVGIG